MLTIWKYKNKQSDYFQCVKFLDTLLVGSKWNIDINYLKSKKIYCLQVRILIKSTFFFFISTKVAKTKPHQTNRRQQKHKT